MFKFNRQAGTYASGVRSAFGHVRAHALTFETNARGGLHLHGIVWTTEWSAEAIRRALADDSFRASLLEFLDSIGSTSLRTLLGTDVAVNPQTRVSEVTRFVGYGVPGSAPGASVQGAPIPAGAALAASDASAPPAATGAECEARVQSAPEPLPQSAPEPLPACFHQALFDTVETLEFPPRGPFWDERDKLENEAPRGESTSSWPAFPRTQRELRTQLEPLICDVQRHRHGAVCDRGYGCRFSLPAPLVAAHLLSEADGLRLRRDRAMLVPSHAGLLAGSRCNQSINIVGNCRARDETAGSVVLDLVACAVAISEYIVKYIAKVDEARLYQARPRAPHARPRAPCPRSRPRAVLLIHAPVPPSALTLYQTARRRLSDRPCEMQRPTCRAAPTNSTAWTSLAY